MLDLWQALTPSTVSAIILSTAVSLFAGACWWSCKQLYEARKARRHAPYVIEGVWFSAEYVPRENRAPRQRNAFTKVRLRKHFFGDKWQVTVLEQYPAAVEINDRVMWCLTGTVRNDTLSGTWESTVPNTKRFGVAIIKFVDNGRAFGYWSGVSRKDYPVYGYWIMSRDRDHLNQLAERALQETTFEATDVIGPLLPYTSMQPLEQQLGTSNRTMQQG